MATIATMATTGIVTPIAIFAPVDRREAPGTSLWFVEGFPVAGLDTGATFLVEDDVTGRSELCQTSSIRGASSPYWVCTNVVVGLASVGVKAAGTVKLPN